MTSMLSFHADGWQFAWDSTSLKNFVSCPRYYQFTNLEGWRSQIRSAHLEFGGHYAKALERFHKLRAEGQAYWDAAKEVLRLLLIETWNYDLDAEGNRIPGTGQAADWMHNTKTRDTLARSVIWYLHHFENDSMETVILDNGKAAVELSFTLELDGEFIYCGHMDRLVSFAGDVMVQDQKTSGSTITSKYFAGFSPDYQMTGYSLAGQIIFGAPIAGVSIDAAQIAVGFTEFSRGFAPRQPAQLEEFRSEVLHYAKLARAYHAAGYFPMNRTSCGMFGGCAFQKVCSGLPCHRTALLEAGFTRGERWDPLKKR